MKTIYKVFSILILLSAAGCKKFVDVPAPYTLTATSSVFNEAQSATAAQLGVYLTFAQYTPFNVARRTGAYSDELTNYDSGTTFSPACYTNSLTANLNLQSWSEFYTVIFDANSVIDGLQNSTALPGNVKSQLMGEAKFTRAFCYFYLINLFGDVPMPLTSDYKINSLLSKTPKAQIYQQMIADLNDATGLLNTNFVDATSINTGKDRIRPTKWAAMALLARIYLYTGDYVNAEAMATAVINNTALFSLQSDLNKVFLKNSVEAIWQLENGTNDSYVAQGYNFILGFYLNTYGESNSSSLSPQLLSAFEPTDNRYTKWVGSYLDYTGITYYFPFKYQEGYTNTPTQNETVLRLAEQYLIRAEARAQQNNPAAITDLNVIRRRAGLANYAGATDKTSLLTAILHERQVELFSEWGHRWFDLVRTGSANAVMSVVTPTKGGTWSNYKQVWPIPFSDLSKDPNLTQNPGY